MKYRPDIDGLRAIAVLAVLFYHAGRGTFSGGYVGVDVFFVISGYLITGKILKEIRANRFSLVSFYELRIRRIVPALFFVVMFSLFVGAWLYNSTDFSELGKSAVATTFSGANFLFWSQAGYFERPSTLKPLLHTWSLSIEEQFYLVLPLLLILISRYFKSKFTLGLSLLAACSFLSSVYVAYYDPSSAFYMAHLRAWEFIVGGLLIQEFPNLRPWFQNLLSFLGLSMVVVPVFAFSDATIFPGLMAAIPVLGSALIIHGGIHGRPLVSKILSAKPFVFIGKISYSLYLWHWPLIVFYKYYLIQAPQLIHLTLWLLGTMMISYFSWKFVETPFRNRSFLVRPRIFMVAGGFLIFSSAIGSTVYVYQGFPGRFVNEEVRLPPDSEWDSEKNGWINCFAREENNYHFPQIDESCTLGDDHRTPSFLLWGDSLADAMSAGLNSSALRVGVSGKVIGGAGCAPLLDIDFSVGTPLEYCYRQNDRIVNYIEQHPEFRTIILASRWALYTSGTRYKTEEGSSPILSDIEPGANVSASNIYLVNVGLNRMVEALTRMNREVVIVSSIPEIGFDVPSSYSIALRTGRDINDIIAPTTQEYLDRNAAAIAIFSGIERKYKNVKVIDPVQLLCDEQKCKVIEDRYPLYRDDDHLSTFGAKFVSGIFDPVLATIPK